MKIDKNKKIQIELTFGQLEKVTDILGSHWDEGPYDEGWQSDELIEIKNIFRKFEDDARENKPLSRHEFIDKSFEHKEP